MFGLQVDKLLSSSITKQLTTQIRYKILQGELKGGEKLPPSRNLAKELNIARNIIVQVYEQLLAEGYLESRVGSGTFVTRLKSYQPYQPVEQNGSSRNKEPVTCLRNDVIDFHAGNPDSRHFPRIQWARILKETCLDAPAGSFEYGSAAGEWPLRSALSQYLFRTKGIHCHPEQILIIPGVARGVELLAEVFREATNKVAVEDPSINFIQCILRQRGFSIYPVPVDHQGMETSNLPKDCTAGLIYVVPSHQFPIGGVLPVVRRLQLLDYALERNSYVIEDDYDSEFRYQGDPIQSLRHLAPDRVIYLGTFSKIFSPGLRLSYIIVPSHIRERVCGFMEKMNIRTSSLEQLAMARFIEDKLLDRHVYKMKKIYENKRMHLIGSLHLAFGDKIRITGENAGLHILVSFMDHKFCPSDFQKFLDNGVEVDWVEDYAILKGFHSNQLVLGYGNLSLEQITAGIQRIKNVFDCFCP